MLKDCYLSLEQLSELGTGLLQKKIKLLETVLLNHLLANTDCEAHHGGSSVRKSVPMQACRLCKLSKIRCEVCNGKSGPQFYAYEIQVASSCQHCGIRAHLECLNKRHRCLTLFGSINPPLGTREYKKL